MFAKEEESIYCLSMPINLYNIPIGDCGHKEHPIMLI
jgi:hypothetical protein